MAAVSERKEERKKIRKEGTRLALTRFETSQINVYTTHIVIRAYQRGEHRGGTIYCFPALFSKATVAKCTAANSNLRSSLFRNVPVLRAG